MSGWVSGQTSISFTEQDVAAFSEASGDRNPLHLSQEYARCTPYGQPVVFGCLGAIACLCYMRLPASWSAVSLDAEFLRPMFSGVEYRVETLAKEGRWAARLFDGSTPVLSLKVRGELSHGHEASEETGTASPFQRRDAALRQHESIVPGLTVSGAYGCNAAALATLAAQWGGVDPFLATVLAWGSYLVGMDLPGESRSSSRLVLNFNGAARRSAALTYCASVVSVDSRFGLLEMDVSLLTGASAVASGQCWSYLRLPVPEVSAVDSTDVREDSLVGRVAVILGASRGLGAAIMQALSSRGAAVYGMARSGDAGGLSRTEVGDAADPEALRRLRERVSREQGRLDFLVCNACPPVLPLRLEPNAAERIGAYIHQAVALTLTPLCEFLELLNHSDGCAVIISSIFVEDPVREFPHYIAAKGAVEALVRVASLQYPRVCSLIVRPPKLLTAMTNTPVGRLDAAPPELLANRIAARLEEPLEPGIDEIMG